MREILFRGKRTDNGEWIYGSPIFQDGYVLIRFWNSEEFEYEEHLVAPETIGQYTGLTDKNGKKIFEGDILSVTVRETVKECGICKLTGRKIKTVWSVEYAERHSQGNGFFVFGKDRRFSLGLTKSVIYNADPEVIGNIHDNPELLKGGAE